MNPKEAVQWVKTTTPEDLVERFLGVSCEVLGSIPEGPEKCYAARDLIVPLLARRCESPLWAKVVETFGERPINEEGFNRPEHEAEATLFWKKLVFGKENA